MDRQNSSSLIVYFRRIINFIPFVTSLTEYLGAVFPATLGKKYINVNLIWLKEEIRCHNFQKGERIFFIGGGAIPYSALLIYSYTKFPVTTLDYRLTAVILAKRFLKAIGKENQVIYVNKSGEDFNDYENFDTVFIAAQVANKKDILEKILKTTVKTRVFIRDMGRNEFYKKCQLTKEMIEELRQKYRFYVKKVKWPHLKTQTEWIIERVKSPEFDYACID